jgi:putative ABC transport system ATP-binding protein
MSSITTAAMSSQHLVTASPLEAPSLLVASSRDLHLVGVSVSYGQGAIRATPVQDLSLFAPCGRVTALVGRSGTGKTSILSCVAATLRPSAGHIWLGGIAVETLTGAALDDFRRTKVGVVHQQYNLIPSLSAVENVSIPLRLGGLDRKRARQRAEALLDRLQLGGLANRKPGELSGGQQQRVAVARALANEPSLVIADEPTAHLDGGSVEDVSNMLRQIADEGRTVVLSTHDDRLLAVADQVVHLSARTATLN